MNPNSLSAGPAGKTIALNNAFVFPLPGAADDPRTPAGPVPACVKWLNDELDGIESMGVRYPLAPLATAVEAEHTKVVAALRVIPNKSVTSAVRMATETSTTENADKWNLSEKDRSNILYTLSKSWDWVSDL